MKLDLGCGGKKCDESFVGVDALALPGVDVVMDIRVAPWPWADNSVEYAFSSHFVEHLTGEERIGFFNELWRVMKPGAQAEIVTPDWSHASAYGDPTHKWPPMSSWYVVYLDRKWREANICHIPYTCDFTGTYGYTPDLRFANQPQELVRQVVGHNINAAQNLHVKLTKRV